ncbi:extracellular catalytic domain type 1 short-chain-length polyhydroxyalkanoate depolymerase [Thermomonospora amylolytica]|uniref:extracellular catalytic domain type 1 short-chain-length polyhydroxyalkanoate depolymerase n=1 Tax=Thermomonospora amylolytica TaxID=1411117 RepID=UPI0018E59EA4|nr:PHB depolymerase family esterase [Thermomonospora amylolytica]
MDAITVPLRGAGPRGLRPIRPVTLPAALAALLATFLASWLAAVPAAQAAVGFHEVTGFGTNPGNLRMFAYVPQNAQSGAPVVVLFHGCGGQAQNLDVGTGWRKYADTWGFTLVMPEQKDENVGSGGIVPHKCFSAWNPEDRTRAGNGEARSVVQMVDHMKRTYQADASRVFVTGYSGGGAATNVMLAAYPDVFKAGAVFFGMAYGCADTEDEYFRTGLFGPCSGPLNRNTPQQWGDEVRSAYPGYTGPRPKVQIWHGGSDRLISPRSLDYQRDQWTNVFGFSRTPTSTSRPDLGVTKSVYGDGRVETWLLDDMGHEAPVDPGTGIQNCGSLSSGHDQLCGPYYAARFFGLG